MDFKKLAVLTGLFFSLMIFACDRVSQDNKKTLEQTIQSVDSISNNDITPATEETSTTAPINDNIPLEDTTTNTLPATTACPTDNFQTINIGQDIITDCENNQISFAFLRDGENLLVKILINAPERIFGINLELLYNPNIVEFLDYTEGDFFQGGIFLINTNTGDICNKSIILGHSLLGQIPGKDGVGELGTLRFKIIVSSPIQMQIKNAAMFKRFFDEDPIPRACLPLNFILN